MKKINLAEKFSAFDELWTPKVVGETNGQLIKLAKVEGEFVWHSHADEDELFMVVSGRLELHFRDRIEVLDPGEILVVPRGVEHRPVAHEETQILLIEPKDTLHTGAVEDDLTVSVEKQEWI